VIPLKSAYLVIFAAFLAVVAVPAAAEDAQGTPTPDQAGPIVVSKRPVQVLAGPSSSASVLYGFPAGRPFRLIGHEAGFAHIQDLKSSATGWIESTAVAETSADATFAPYAPRQNPTAVAAPQQNSAQQPGSANDRRGPLGGFLGGLFGNH
jgi:hypothetical protein